MMLLMAGATIVTTSTGVIRATTNRNPGNWGLWRIDQPDLAQARAAKQLRYLADGTGVNIYVIDFGVLSNHPDFCCDTHSRSRVTWVGAFCWGAMPRTVDPQTGQPYPETVAGDGYDGHGTHNASYAAGLHSGAATNAHIYALRVRGPEGGDCATEQAIVNAINWIVANNGPARAVVNLSLRVTTDAVHSAIHNSINPPSGFGFTYTLTGNTGGSVDQIWGNVIPNEALVVGGTDSQDNPIANVTTHAYGPLLALFAPAKGLCGASLGEAFNFTSPCAAGLRYSVPEVAVCPHPCTNPIPGDSFAAPLVAGVAAVYLQQHKNATPKQVREALRAQAALNRVTNSGTSENRLLQMVRDDVPGNSGATVRPIGELFRRRTTRSSSS
jgi:subtilisin family serine protease